MNIMIVDDEELMIQALDHELKAIFPNEVIKGFQNEQKALEWSKKMTEEKQTLAYSFLDIHIGKKSGIDLAIKIKALHPNSKIIFCTAFCDYAFEAFQLHAIGYLLKPVMAENIIHTLQEMDKDWSESLCIPNKILVRTFGSFEVFYEGKPVYFERQKAKELFAYLIDRHGAAITTAEAATVLWEDKPYDSGVKNQVHNIISSLRKTLKSIGKDNVLIKKWNHLAINTEMIECDIYELQTGNTLAINEFQGEYMLNYSWAELTNAELANRKDKNRF